MSAPASLPRLGFAGVGWIGQARLRALLESGAAEVAAVADPSAELRSKAATLVPSARVEHTFEALLEMPLDGVVIATPSALHAPQAVQALERGLAVFCQKPLGRSASEARSVVEAARRADRLLALDLSYRETRGMQAVKQLVRSGELGPIHHARLVFHNAYGPDKPWYYDVGQAGGGCVMDLGVHLVDLALWTLDFPEVVRVDSVLYAQGERLEPGATKSEDLASARLELAGGASVEIACSWNLPAGQDAVISADFYGSRGGAAFHNVGGSFYDFEALRLERQQRRVLASHPDEWGGRALIKFARELGVGRSFRAHADELVRSAELLDRIYGRHSPR